MVEPVWRYVLHATKQGWLVDEFIERGKVPVTAERIESAHCPRGKVFLLIDPESYLNTLKADPVWRAEAKEFAQTWHDREMDRLIKKIVESPPGASSVVKIASIT